MATKSSEAFENKCFKENLSGELTGKSNLGMGAVDAAAAITGTQGSPNLLRRLTRGVLVRRKQQLWWGGSNNCEEAEASNCGGAEASSFGVAEATTVVRRTH